MTLLATLECFLPCPKMPRYVRAFRVSLAVFLSFRDPKPPRNLRTTDADLCPRKRPIRTLQWRPAQ